MASSMTPLPSWGHYNKIRCNMISGHVMVLALASCDTNGIIIGTAELLRLRWLKWGANDFVVIWYYWHLHVIPVVFWMAPLNSLDQDNQNEVQHDFSVMLQHCYQIKCHMTLTVLWIMQLNPLGQGDENEVHHVFFQHVMPLALLLTLHDANSVINGANDFLRSRWSKWGSKWLVSSCDATGISIPWHWWCLRW